MVTSNTQPGTFRVPQSVAIFTFHTKKHGCWLSVHIAPRQVEDCVGLYGCQPPATSPPPDISTNTSSGDTRPSTAECGVSTLQLQLTDSVRLCSAGVVYRGCWPQLQPSPCLITSHQLLPSVARRDHAATSDPDTTIYTTPHHSHPPSVCRPTLNIHSVALPPSQIYYLL